MRPDAYLIGVAGQMLYAPTLAEVAEIAECAIEADDPIELLGARIPEGWRALSGKELGRFWRLLAARIDVPAQASGEERQPSRALRRGFRTADLDGRMRGRLAVAGVQNGPQRACETRFGDEVERETDSRVHFRHAEPAAMGVCLHRQRPVIQAGVVEKRLPVDACLDGGRRPFTEAYLPPGDQGGDPARGPPQPDVEPHLVAANRVRLAAGHPQVDVLDGDGRTERPGRSARLALIAAAERSARDEARQERDEEAVDLHLPPLRMSTTAGSAAAPVVRRSCA
jgi:hypothetical protein